MPQMERVFLMFCRIHSPLGILTLTEASGALISLEFTPDALPRAPESALLAEAEKVAASEAEYVSYDDIFG